MMMSLLLLFVLGAASGLTEIFSHPFGRSVYVAYASCTDEKMTM